MQVNKKQQKQDGIVDGFSSDQQIKHQEILLEGRKKTEVEVTHKEEVRFKIPPPQEIKAKAYSLNPDIATGWAPKIQLPTPIPMFFDHRRVDAIVKKFIQKKYQKMRLIYLGPRFQNTFYAWYDKKFQFPYNHIKTPHNMKFTNRAFCGQHWDAEDGLIFDSLFQSGNLDLVIQVGERQYDVYLRVDSNTRGHLQWFNFKIKGLEKLQKYRINICNLQKNKSLYSRGQKPYIYSAKRFEKQKKGWQQAGDSLVFQQKPGKSAKVLNCEFTSSYKLSFDYYTMYDNDQIQIAYCIPYTYSQLLDYIKNLQQRPQTKQFITQSKLCLSLGGLQIPMLTIHQNFNKQIETKIMEGNTDLIKSTKKCIIISGRVHPGQSNGSHMMYGFLQFLCGDSKQAKMLRQNFIFKIVPMLNPDGVVLGNYRTGISGRDFNRQYRNPDKAIFPQVYAFKKLVIDNKSIYRENLFMFLDFHGHSTKKNVFVYGPEFPIIHRYYYECRIFPKIIGNHTMMFRYYSCSFKVSQFKETTARAIFLRKVMIPLSYTIQASNGCYYDPDTLKDIPFTLQSWVQMGLKVGTALAEYCDLIIQSQRSRLLKIQSRKAKRDIKIRKSSKSKSSQPQQTNQIQSYNNIQKQPILLTSNENQKIKKIFEEIKVADEQKQILKNEEDEISQGSSDGEGQKDDLSPQKLNLLFQIIKNKKTTISEKNRKKFAKDDLKHSKTNQQINSSENNIKEQNQNLQVQIKPVQIILQLPQFEPKQQQIFRPNYNIRGYLLKNKNTEVAYLQTDKKKQKIAAKIINFSFIGHSRPLNYSTQRKNLNNRNGLSEPPSLSKLDKSVNEDLKNKIKNPKVLDLSSDNTFKNTYTNSLAVELTNRNSKNGDRRNLTFINFSPRKIGANKLQQFKYKRLFIDQYKI